MNLTQLLRDVQIDPADALVMRHRPPEEQLYRKLPWLVVTQPDVFNAYQQTQSLKPEKALQKKKYLVSFYGDRSKRGERITRATFIGIYHVDRFKSIPTANANQIPQMIELFKHGLKPTSELERPQVIWFDLTIMPHYQYWQGKLVIDWPEPAIVWCRHADQSEFKIAAIREESSFDSEVPEWKELIMTIDDLKVIPNKLRAALEQWCCIYYIFDTVKKLGYVGSAYGKAKLLGRWEESYAQSGHGGNKLLKDCDPKNFRFSILERLSPDAKIDEVTQKESQWKKRLHTREFGLNDN